jgi:hypothetical protein
MKHKKPDYKALVPGFFVLKELNEYIIGKIQLEAFLNIYFSKEEIIFSISAISGTRKPMKYSFSFNIFQCFLEGEISEHYFYDLVDRYIVEINDNFRSEYLK